MLISVNDVAKRLKISNRAVQIKCKRYGVVKIGNQYQITEEIVQRWEEKKEQKRERIPNEPKQKQDISQANTKKSSSLVSFIVVLLILMLSGLCALYYIDLKEQISVSKATIIKKDSIYQKEIKRLNNNLNEAKETIYKRDLKIQELQFRDSLIQRRKW
jgi:hypothetical protein